MLIGILSDTHNHVETMAPAMELLRQRGVEFYIHCGDVGGPQILDFFAGLRAAFVWGNCDYDRFNLNRHAQIVGVSCFGSLGQIELDNKQIVFLHGDDYQARQRILADQKCDYLFQGHSHIREDIRVGRIHVINPGALYRASVKTVALLDTRSDGVEFLAVK